MKKRNAVVKINQTCAVKKKRDKIKTLVNSAIYRQIKAALGPRKLAKYTLNIKFADFLGLRFLFAFPSAAAGFIFPP